MRQVRTISRKDFGPVLDVEAIPVPLGNYLTGFADGEGSFNVSFRPRGDYRHPWKISLCFNVSQRDKTVLVLLQEHLGAGTTRMRDDGVWYFEVNALEDICRTVIPFFERFTFQSVKKQRDFAKFRRLAELMLEGKHLTLEGVREILAIRKDMNDGGKRRYTDEMILARYTPDGSSETVRRTPVMEMRQSELHGDMQSGSRNPTLSILERATDERS